MFGPFSSSLTLGVISVTDAAEKVIMTAGSAYDSVWNGTVEYGFGRWRERWCIQYFKVALKPEQ
jgi:hypothetical protein